MISAYFHHFHNVLSADWTPIPVRNLFSINYCCYIYINIHNYFIF